MHTTSPSLDHNANDAEEPLTIEIADARNIMERVARAYAATLTSRLKLLYKAAAVG